MKSGNTWFFDTEQGAHKILLRRIGRNELAAIQVCHAIVEAQLEYAVLDTNNDGLLEYAAKWVSSPGKHDGLYWETKEEDPQSPLGSLLATAALEGYTDSTTRPLYPFHGYFYKLLTSQGPAALGGALNFLLLPATGFTRSMNRGFQVNLEIENNKPWTYPK